MRERGDFNQAFEETVAEQVPDGLVEKLKQAFEKFASGEGADVVEKEPSGVIEQRHNNWLQENLKRLADAIPPDIKKYWPAITGGMATLGAMVAGADIGAETLMREPMTGAGFEAFIAILGIFATGMGQEMWDKHQQNK